MLDWFFTMRHIVNRPMHLCLCFIFGFLIVFVCTWNWFIEDQVYICSQLCILCFSVTFFLFLFLFFFFLFSLMMKTYLCYIFYLFITYTYLCLFVCCQYIKRPYGPVGEAAVERSQAHKGIGPKKTRPPSLTLTLTGRCQIPPGSSVRPIELFLWQVQVRPCKLWQRPFLHNSRVDVEIHIIDAIFAR